jgi:hypothetical protein
VQNIRYVYWHDGEMWLGYLEEYPDYKTQGESSTDLEEHLRDLHTDRPHKKSLWRILSRKIA